MKTAAVGKMFNEKGKRISAQSFTRQVKPRDLFLGNAYRATVTAFNESGKVDGELEFFNVSFKSEAIRH